MSGADHYPPPPDPHREIPAGAFGNAFTPSEYDIIIGQDYHGAPVGYVLQTVELANGWHERILNGDHSDEFLREINNSLEERAFAYPDAAIWDTFRGALAESFSRAGRRDIAFDYLTAITSPHQIVETLEQLEAIECEQGSHNFLIFSAYVARLGGDENRLKRKSLARAYADWFIYHDPFNPLVDKLESMVAEDEADYDSVGSWVASQSAYRPELNWQNISEVIKNDGALWEDVPQRVRQHTALHVQLMQLELYAAPSVETLEPYLLRIIELERRYPKAEIWGVARGLAAQVAVSQGRYELGLPISQSTNDHKLQTSIALTLLEAGAENEALGVVLRTSSARAMARALIDFPWSKEEKEAASMDRGGKEFYRIIQQDEGDEYSVEHRLDFLTVARIRAEQAGNSNGVAYWQSLIDQLKTTGKLTLND